MYLSSQLKRFDLVEDSKLVNDVLKINGKDHKMNKAFRMLVGLPEP